MTDDFSVAEWKAFAAALGAEVDVVTDAFGRADVRFDRDGMEKIRAVAREHGFNDLADNIDRCLSGRRGHIAP